MRRPESGAGANVEGGRCEARQRLLVVAACLATVERAMRNAEAERCDLHPPHWEAAHGVQVVDALCSSTRPTQTRPTQIQAKAKPRQDCGRPRAYCGRPRAWPRSRPRSTGAHIECQQAAASGAPVLNCDTRLDETRLQRSTAAAHGGWPLAALSRRAHLPAVKWQTCSSITPSPRMRSKRSMLSEKY